MAYSPIKQPHVDLATTSSHNLTSGTAPSPRLADRPVTPLSLSFDDFMRESNEEDSSPVRNNDSKVTKFLTSLTSSRQSYDLVEDDDYEVTEQETPTLERHSRYLATSTKNMQTQEDAPVRSASISRQLPLSHPIPDLQSIQGAYIRNVVRLEESAERLSMESNLEEELQRMKVELRQHERTVSQSSRANSTKSESQRHVPKRSLGNSIVDVNSTARVGGYSPGAYVTSPVDSLKSPKMDQNGPARRISKSSRLSYALPDLALRSQEHDSEMAIPGPFEIPNLDPRPYGSQSPPNALLDERPLTSGSGDTYQQAKTLFNDFDGVHYSPNKRGREMRRISITRPPRARDSRAFREPQPGEEMIYYPAPVPVMLNLPMRLSRMNWSDQEKKRLQALSGIPDEMRKSAAWLANEEMVPSTTKRNTAMLPPQLRASAFFDHRGTTSDVQLKDGSAVATLDSILDAAAHAPVSAFTDHPIAGHLGNDFFSAEPSTSRKSVQMPNEKKTKRKSSMSNLLKRRSSGNLSEAMKRESRIPSMTLSKRDEHESEEDHIEDEAERSILPDADEIPDHENEHEHEHGEDKEIRASASDPESESESEFHPGFSAAPTTLLAELQMRKAQQRMRNRTAADAFPNGMHSTLLELDTVTQLQQKARRQKHIKLAWEDKDAVDKQNFDDEDVPLGILFPEKDQDTRVNQNRPLGLMEKKELEENEPLSHRRARLRGDALPIPPRSPGLSQQAEVSNKPVLDLPSLEIPEDDNEGETLAQRKLRVKNRVENGSSAEFAKALSSDLGLKVEDGGERSPSLSGPKTPEIEETLGQRRKRLQAEALNGSTRPGSGGNQEARPVLRTQKSLADVLRANPIGYVDPNQGKTALLAMQNHERGKEREVQYFAAQEAERQRAFASQNTFGQGNQNGLMQTSFNTYQGYQQPLATPGNRYMPGNTGPNIGQVGYVYPSINSFGAQPVQVNPGVGVANMHANYAYQYPMQGYGYQSAVDLLGMGPPLDQKQRARIEGWRQGIM